MRDKYGINEFMSDFPREEYEARSEKAQSLMDEQNINGMLLGKEENVAYFSGYRRMIKYQFAYMILPKNRPPILITSIDQRANAETMSWIDDIRFFGPTNLGLSDATETGLKVLNELELNNSVMGVEANPQICQRKTWDALLTRLTNIKIVDEILWKLRMIKTPLELQYIRKACDITCGAFSKGLDEVREGMTERELARIVYRSMIEKGAEDTPLKGCLNLRAGPRRYSMFDTRPTDNKFKKGDFVILDGGITYKSYWCDITRLTCIGQPSNRQQRFFDACLEAEIAGVEALQPGKAISDVYEAVEKVLTKHGMTQNKFPGEMLGHGVGLEIHEPPHITPQSSTILEPGMVLAMEPCLYDDPVMKSIIHNYQPGGEGVFFVEDNILITEKGPEILTPYPPKTLNIVMRNKVVS
jgi:Xaa-Pro aminopeptidase